MRQHAGTYPTRKRAEDYAYAIAAPGWIVYIEERTVFDIYVENVAGQTT